MNQSDFKNIMSLLAKGVAVLTCARDGQNYGITVSSLTSVGIEPPTLAVCVEGHSSLIQVIRQTKKFAVTLLSAEQKDIGVLFSDSTILHADRFARVPSEILDGCPVISGGLASMVCELECELEISQNVVFFGRMVLGNFKAGKPLLYFSRNWETIS